MEDELSERLRNLSEGGADKHIGRLQLAMPMSNLLIAPNGQTSNLLISVGRTRSWSNVLPRGPSREWREKLLNSRKDKDGAQFLRELRDWIV